MGMAGRLFSMILMAGGVLLGGCATRVSDEAPSAPAESASSILISSKPAAGSTVSASIDELRLHFDPPARLDEVTISSPGGQMPMMVHAVGEAADYSIPLPGLDAGTYAVSWRATSAGRSYSGTFGFSVRD
jgi:methionine-rich copper-binding protein CopC